MIAPMLGIVLMVWVCSSPVYGQNLQPPFPREEATRLTAEIRKNPDDDQLRRELIDLLREHARSLKPLSDKTYKLIGQAAALVDSGKPINVERAIALYQRVANAAPWHVSIYMDLGMAYDEMHNWQQAKRYYDLFLYAGRDYAVVPAELSITQEALQRVEHEMASGRR